MELLFKCLIVFVSVLIISSAIGLFIHRPRRSKPSDGAQDKEK